MFLIFKSRNNHRKVNAEIYWLSDIKNTMIDEYFSKVQTT